MRHRWTISEFFLLLALLLLLAVLCVHVTLQISVPPKKLVSSVPINTDPTDPSCWQWSAQYPHDSYDGCQRLHSASGGREKNE